MDFSNIQYNEDVIIVEGIKNFDLVQTLECGQCFRWEKVDENKYIGIAYDKVLEVEQVGDTLKFYNTNQKDFNNIWRHYFDLDRDYSEIKRELSKDSILSEALSYGTGIRVLNQEPYEMVISFIISARNSIPVIKRTIKIISEIWGEKIEYKGNIYHTFPKKEVLAFVTEAQMKEAGGSFRSKYIVDTSHKIYTSEMMNRGEGERDEEFLKLYDLERIMKLEDQKCHIALQNYNGVGAKVADCIMLFSMGKTSAFPVDVWVKRAMIHFYGAKDSSLPKIRSFGIDRFGKYAGFAQQYLFYYTKEKGIKL
ncbi:MAG: DNA-3-methyladenine glycosylase family protein [Sarcina sp.]